MKIITQNISVNKSLSILVVIILYLIACDSKSYEEGYKSADNYYEKGEYKSAIEELEKIIDLNEQKHFKGTLLLGDCYKRNFDYDKAIAIYKDALKFNKESGELYFRIGSCYYDDDNLGEATEYFSLALKKDFKPHLCNWLLGDISFKQKQYNDALNYFLKEIEIEPDSSFGYFYASSAYIELNRWDSAKVFLHKGIERDSSEAWGYYDLSLCSVYLNQLDSSLIYIQKALKLDSTNTEFHFLNGAINLLFLNNRSDYLNAFTQLEDILIEEHTYYNEE